MKNYLRTILAMLVVIICIKVVALFLFICYIGYFDKQTLNPLDNIEKKIDQAQEKSLVLTGQEKELEKVATEKEWEEVDKDANK